MNKKTSYSNEFKFKVALEAIRSQKTIPQLVQEFNVASCLISKWKKQVLDSGSIVFNNATKPATVDNQEKKLYEQLGRQAMEIDYLKQFAGRYQ
jgi:transposase-like protein